MWLLAKFERADLKPNKPKFQAFTTTPGAHLAASPPDWLRRPFVITDPALKRRYPTDCQLFSGSLENLKKLWT